MTDSTSTNTCDAFDLFKANVSPQGDYKLNIEFGLTKKLPGGNGYEFVKYSPGIEFTTDTPEKAFETGFTFLQGVVIAELKKLES